MIITALAFYAMVSAACFYLGTRALITKRLWSTYPYDIARFMDCAACTGFWWGFLWSAIVPAEAIAPEAAAYFPRGVPTSILIGLCMIVLTPLAAAAMQWGLNYLGTAVPELPQTSGAEEEEDEEDHAADE